ncbi:receptor-like protein kinase ANXUR2 [Cornus florida]|uniref:receptor-like protein kinase ANXUR2 n=1 Tax=Cornus florida TaxID=4283 RepID=UPI0028984DBF|nr:receptor-like protein kinase ANXUR2 [Cornus florida]
MEEDYGDERRLLSTWAVECIEAESVEDIIDPYLMGKISPLCLNVFVEIAKKCVLKSGTERPPMNDVVRNLELALQLQETADAVVGNSGLVTHTTLYYLEENRNGGKYFLFHFIYYLTRVHEYIGLTYVCVTITFKCP